VDKSSLLLALQYNINYYKKQLNAKLLTENENRLPQVNISIPQNYSCVSGLYVLTMLVIHISDLEEFENDSILLTAFDLAYEMLNARFLYTTTNSFNESQTTSEIPPNMVPWLDNTDFVFELGTLDPYYVYPYTPHQGPLTSTVELLFNGLTPTKYITAVFIIVIVFMLLIIGIVYAFGSSEENKVLFGESLRDSYVQ
jgi:hypothetical protein